MTLLENKRIHFDYKILEKFEAGLELKGFEVKSIAAGRANLSGAHAVLKENEVWLLNLDIPPYQPSNTPEAYDSKRTRKLLLKKSEIVRMVGKISQTQLTLIALSLYNSKNHVKVEFALCRQKQKADKREDLRTKDDKLRMRRIVHQGFEE